MGRKRDNKPVMGVDTRDPAEIRQQFLAMRTRVTQAVSRADGAAKECERLESHLHLLTARIQLSRASLVTLQADLDGIIKGIEDARRAELKTLN